MRRETHDAKIQRCWQTKAATIETTSSEGPIPVDDGEFNNIKGSIIVGKSCTPPPYPPMHPLTIPDTTPGLSPTPKNISPHLLPTHLSISAEALRVTPDRPSINISLSINLRSDRLHLPEAQFPAYRHTFPPSTLPLPSHATHYSYPWPSFRTFSLTCNTHHIPDNPAPSPRNPITHMTTFYSCTTARNQPALH